MINFFKKNIVKLNVAFVIAIFVISASIVAYRLFNPEPLLEHRACMDRLNMIALEYAKFYDHNQKYPEITTLFSDPHDIFLTCPADGGRYMATVDESGYKVKCGSCGLYLKNNILKRK